MTQSDLGLDAVLLVGHGTVDQLDEIPAFLAKIRRGRPSSPELIQTITDHYREIGGSPLKATSQAQATALQARLGLPCLLAMRLWNPLVEDVVQQAHERGLERLLVLPLAPFSVELYFQAAQRAVQARGLAQVTLHSVAAWGSHPRFIDAWAQQIAPHCQAQPDAALLLTAHSLPTAVIRAGDRYQSEVTDCADKIAAALGRSHTLAFQSQGADGGDWIGPGLQETLQQLAAAGVRKVIAAPVGFLSDHVETLYDLDIEAAGWAQDLGLQWLRVQALNESALLIDTLAAVARESWPQLG
jgi:ferrochelatase